MNIRDTLLEMINSTTNRYSYMAIEKLIVIMLRDYLNLQNKKLILEEQYGRFDVILPDGIDDIWDRVAVEIKMFRHNYMLSRVVYDTIGRFSMNSGDIKTLLIIFVNEVPESIRNKIEERKEQLNFRLIIWDIDKLVQIFSKNENLFAETYNNINKIYLKETISSGIYRNKENYLKNRKKYIKQLHKEYVNDNMVLFLGAGASIDAKVATWDDLISELFVTLINKQLTEENFEIEYKDKERIAKELIAQNGNSPLLQTRFLRKGFEDDFEVLVSEILYKNAIETSELLEEIGQLCISNRGKIGLVAIVNYNFDDLVEKNLERLRVKYCSIYCEGLKVGLGELGIYHVHGFLPQRKDVYEHLIKSLLVFSEEGYHKLMLEPYNWANITQLNYMINNTCVFIGLSMTDPNLRRLLEIAAVKDNTGNIECRHYAIMLRLNLKSLRGTEALESFEKANESLQESLFRELGINVIWINDYSEIPEILRQIKGYLE